MYNSTYVSALQTRHVYPSIGMIQPCQIFTWLLWIFLPLSVIILIIHYLLTCLIKDILTYTTLNAKVTRFLRHWLPLIDHSRVSTAVADDLASVWLQPIYNHQVDLWQSASSLLLLGVPSHLQPPYWHRKGRYDLLSYQAVSSVMRFFATRSQPDRFTLPLPAILHSISYSGALYPARYIIERLVQERRNSSALAMELRLSCINPP